MPNPLFSKYSQGENRVTASILAVFERISFALLERILQILCEETGQSLLEVKNQIKLKGANSVPDGAIQASFAYWLETKVVANTVSQIQIEEHLKSLENHPHAANKKLIVLTPDSTKPNVLVDVIKSPRVVWANFNTLTDAIATVLSFNETWLTGDLPLASEQERFLLRELVQMFLAEGLLNIPLSDLALIVPARSAINDYEQFSVLASNEANQITDDVKERLNGLVEALKKANSDLYDQTNPYGKMMKVFFLSSPNASETIHLDRDIQNDLRASSGRPTAFTQGQRYVPLASLKKSPATTSELLKLDNSQLLNSG